MADDRGDPQPARGTRALLSFAPSYAVLCAAQALIVLAARPPTTRGRRGLAGALLPAAALGVAVAIIRAVAGGPHALALLAMVVRARLRAAAATGLAAGAWGLLLFFVSTVPATVPVLTGLAFARARRRHL